jgi:hypothetical protein
MDVLGRRLDVRAGKIPDRVPVLRDEHRLAVRVETGPAGPVKNVAALAAQVFALAQAWNMFAQVFALAQAWNWAEKRLNRLPARPSW